MVLKQVFDYSYEEMLEILNEQIKENGQLRLAEPPFTNEEIGEFERHIGARLPEDFRDYLLNVSKEMCLDSYPVKVELVRNGICVLCGSSDMYNPCPNGSSNIPTQVERWIHYFMNGKKPKCKVCKEEYQTDCKTGKCINSHDGMIEIAYGGCVNMYRIVIKGPQKGTIWYIWDDFTQRIEQSFADYCNSKMRNWRGWHQKSR